MQSGISWALAILGGLAVGAGTLFGPLLWETTTVVSAIESPCAERRGSINFGGGWNATREERLHLERNQTFQPVANGTRGQHARVEIDAEEVPLASFGPDGAVARPLRGGMHGVSRCAHADGPLGFGTFVALGSGNVTIRYWE